MKSIVYPVLLILTFLIGPLEASSTLDWQDQEFTYRATPNDTSVVAPFRFANVSDATVTIDRVETSCGCSVAKLEKKVYASGETGTLEITIKLKNVSGKRDLMAKVYTDGEAEPSKILNIHVEVPKVVSVSRRLLFWHTGEPVRPKQVIVEFDHEEPVKIKEVISSDPLFTTEFRSLEPGRQYAVTVTPTTTALRKQQVVPVTIVSDLPYPRHKNQTIYARIVPALTSALPVRLEPPAAVWKVGESASPKSIRMVVTDEKPLVLRPMGESYESQAFTTELRTVEEGRVYELIMTPKDTTNTASEFFPFHLQWVLDSGKLSKPLKRPVVASAMVVK